MATAPFSVKVLSFKFITLSSGLMAKAWASAVMPGWLIPFCGIWTSSRVPMIWERIAYEKSCQWTYFNSGVELHSLEFA